MAILGHRRLKEAQRYTATAERQVLAADAMPKLARSRRKPEVSHFGHDGERWDEDGPQVIQRKGVGKGMVPRGGIEPPTLRFSVAD
jgi:hypothetical protein